MKSKISYYTAHFMPIMLGLMYSQQDNPPTVANFLSRNY